PVHAKPIHSIAATEPTVISRFVFSSALLHALSARVPQAFPALSWQPTAPFRVPPTRPPQKKARPLCQASLAPQRPPPPWSRQSFRSHLSVHAQPWPTLLRRPPLKRFLFGPAAWANPKGKSSPAAGPASNPRRHPLAVHSSQFPNPLRCLQPCRPPYQKPCHQALLKGFSPVLMNELALRRSRPFRPPSSA